VEQDTQSAADDGRDWDEPSAEADELDTDPYGVDQASPLGWGYYWREAVS